MSRHGLGLLCVLQLLACSSGSGSSSRRDPAQFVDAGADGPGVERVDAGAPPSGGTGGRGGALAAAGSSSDAGAGVAGASGKSAGAAATDGGAAGQAGNAGSAGTNTAPAPDSDAGIEVSACELNCERYSECTRNRCSFEPSDTARQSCEAMQLEGCRARCAATPAAADSCSSELASVRQCMFDMRDADGCPVPGCESQHMRYTQCLTGGASCGMPTGTFFSFFDVMPGDRRAAVWQDHCACPNWPGGAPGAACGFGSETSTQGGDCAAHCCRCGTGQSFGVSACPSGVCIDGSTLCDQAIALFPQLCG